MKTTLSAFLLACLASVAVGQNSTNVLISLFATDLGGCDDLSACDLFVKIHCQKALENEVKCGETANISDDNFPVWPERFTFAYNPAEQMKWRFELRDADTFFDDEYAILHLTVEEFLATTPTLQTKRITIPGNKGYFYIHRREA